MSFQRDGWDPKWGEEGAEGSDEPAPPVETRRKKNKNQPESVARDDAWDEVDEDLPPEEETEAEAEPAPVAEPAPDTSLDVETVAIPVPDKDAPSDTIETVPLQPTAEPKKKKNDAEEKEEKEKKGAAK